MDPVFSNYSPTVLYVEKYRFSSNWVYDDARIPYCIFRYIYSGRATFAVDNIPYTVQAGDVFYIPQGCRLYCESQEEIEFVSVRFFGNIQIPEVDTLRQLWGIGQLYHCGDQPQIRDWFEAMYRSAIGRSTYKQLISRGYLNLLCAELARRSAENMEDESSLRDERAMMESMFDMKYIRRRATASQQKVDTRIQSLVDYIVLHPRENLTREQMCSICSVSDSTLRRLFKAYMGKSITDFVKDTKMMYAAHQLVTTNDPISEIGYQLGYETPSYFSKTFRDTFGVSPQEYRKNSLEA